MKSLGSREDVAPAKSWRVGKAASSGRYRTAGGLQSCFWPANSVHASNLYVNTQLGDFKEPTLRGNTRIYLTQFLLLKCHL